MMVKDFLEMTLQRNEGLSYAGGTDGCQAPLQAVVTPRGRTPVPAVLRLFSSQRIVETQGCCAWEPETVMQGPRARVLAEVMQGTCAWVPEPGLQGPRARVPLEMQGPRAQVLAACRTARGRTPALHQIRLLSLR